MMPTGPAPWIRMRESVTHESFDCLCLNGHTPREQINACSCQVGIIFDSNSNIPEFSRNIVCRPDVETRFDCGDHASSQRRFDITYIMNIQA
jgi:hypothetical protein